MSPEALLYCALLALQFGLQPIVSRAFTPKDVAKSSLVIATEIWKILISVGSIAMESSEAKKEIAKSWSIVDSLWVAALPATLYAIQNMLIQHGYAYLDAMTFNLLNQTKTLSAAFFLWIMIGQKQSYIQMVALLMLLAAAVILNSPEEMFSLSLDKPTVSDSNPHYHWGVVLVMTASMMSGLSTSLCQKSAKTRHSLLFSLELAVYGIIFLVVASLFSDDKEILLSGRLFDHWTPQTSFPVVLNACGGLVVGLVTKYAGGVVKGFALIAGIVVTGFAQWLLFGKALSAKDWIAVALVCISIYLHTSFPPSNSNSRSNLNELSNSEQKKSN